MTEDVKKYRPVDKYHAVGFYLKGASLEAASRDFNVPIQTIRDALNKLERGIKGRKQLTRPKKLDAGSYITKLYSPIKKKVAKSCIIIILL